MKITSMIGCVLAMLLCTFNSAAQIKNKSTQEVQVSGNCSMCKATIEKAGNQKNIAHVLWDEAQGTATLSYNSEKTSVDEILKRIALAGYDNENFRAPDEVYAKLPECCQYDRDISTAAQTVEDVQHAEDVAQQQEDQATSLGEAAPLAAVFEHYFLVKDALVKSDVAAVTKEAALLSQELSKVDVDGLSSNVHPVWLQVEKPLSTITAQIANRKDIANQRRFFAQLSKPLHDLVQVAQLSTVIYYQDCPMYDDGKGATWFSKQASINNPYFGAQMLTCGTLVETIQ